MTKLLKPLIVAGLLLAGSSAVYADDAPAAMPHQGWQMDPAKREAMMAKHMQMLHDKLKIQPQQEAAWKTFIASMKSEHGTKPAENANETAPERMEHMMQTHQAEMQKRLDALKTFYAQLTPEQQKIMDQMHGPRDKWPHRGKHEASAPAKG